MKKLIYILTLLLVGLNSHTFGKNREALFDGGVNGLQAGIRHDPKGIDVNVLGILTYQTLLELKSVDPLPLVGTAAKVVNDGTFLNNGNYTLVFGSWVKDSELYDLYYRNQDVKAEALKPNAKSNVSIEGDFIYFSSPFDDTQNVTTKLEIRNNDSFSTNPNVNIRDVYLSLKASPKLSNNNIKHSFDDITPVKINGSYIGANHGWAQARIITLLNHGKTLADVGAVYEDTLGIKFVILRIVDSNSFWLCAYNQGEGESYSFPSPSGTLTYISNGDNKSNIAGYSQIPLGNLRPMTSKSKVSILIDGNREFIYEDSNFSCEFMEVSENYLIYDLPSVVEKVVENRPMDGYLEEVYFNNLGAFVVAELNINYRLDSKGTMIISTDFLPYKDVDVSYIGFVQTRPLTEGSLYIPKTLPIHDGLKTRDFRTLEPWTTFGNKKLIFSSDYWEYPTSPPDRAVNLNDKTVIHTGLILDRGNLKNRQNDINEALFLSSSQGKIYFKGIDNEKVKKNKSVSGVAFRQFYKNDQPAFRINFSEIDLDDSVFIFLDYQSLDVDKIEMNSKYVGKKIIIVEKSANMSILSSVVTPTLKVRSSLKNSYSFAVLKIEK